MFNNKKTKKDAQKILGNIFVDLMSVFDKDTEKLSKIEFDLCLIEILEMEVNNGGFDLYFVNSYSRYVDDTIKALDKIGSVVFKDILKRAKKQYPSDSIPKDRSERVNLLMDKGKVFDKLDKEFYAAYAQENIHDMLLKYYNENK